MERSVLKDKLGNTKQAENKNEVFII